MVRDIRGRGTPEARVGKGHDREEQKPDGNKEDGDAGPDQVRKSAPSFSDEKYQHQ
jgi:hypothetical protein